MTDLEMWARRDRVYIHSHGMVTPFLAHVKKQLLTDRIQRWLDGFRVSVIGTSNQCKVTVVSKSQGDHTLFILEPRPDGILISCQTYRHCRKRRSRYQDEKGSVSVLYTHNLPKQMNILQRSLWSRYVESS